MEGISSSYIRDSMRYGVYGAKRDENDALSQQEADDASPIAIPSDSVSISEKAQQMYEDRKAEEAETGEQQDGGAGGGLSEGGLSGGDSASGGNRVAYGKGKGKEEEKKADQASLDALREQIAEAEKELAKATESLQTATTGNAQEVQDVVDAESGEDEVDTVRMQIVEINNRLMKLREEYSKAQREALGVSAGGGGCISGTPVGSGLSPGGVSRPVGHIGSSTDPYADARAFEQAELSGGGTPAAS